MMKTTSLLTLFLALSTLISCSTEKRSQEDAELDYAIDQAIASMDSETSSMRMVLLSYIHEWGGERAKSWLPLFQKVRNVDIKVQKAYQNLLAEKLSESEFDSIYTLHKGALVNDDVLGSFLSDDFIESSNPKLKLLNIKQICRDYTSEIARVFHVRDILFGGGEVELVVSSRSPTTYMWYSSLAQFNSSMEHHEWTLDSIIIDSAISKSGIPLSGLQVDGYNVKQEITIDSARVEPFTLYARLRFNNQGKLRDVPFSKYYDPREVPEYGEPVFVKCEEGVR